jgi:hypothetical protein
MYYFLQISMVDKVADRIQEKDFDIDQALSGLIAELERDPNELIAPTREYELVVFCLISGQKLISL